jgi:hypothetical protein
MGRTPHIQSGAKSTTIYLTKAQRVAIRKFQTKRLQEGDSEPLLNEVVLEGLRLLLQREGCTEAELGTVFPKAEVKRAKVTAFPKRRRGNRPTV